MAAGYDVHDHTYFLSVPFYRLVEVYDTPVERGEQLMYFTLGYNRASSTERFRQFRDAIVQQADAWARSGRHGYTSEDACNVARAFRDLKLDGEYGRGTDATCGGVGAGSTTRDDRYVCTTAYCPLCPVENPNPCARVPSPSEPHCGCTTQASHSPTSSTGPPSTPESARPASKPLSVTVTAPSPASARPGGASPAAHPKPSVSARADAIQANLPMCLLPHRAAIVHQPETLVIGRT